MDWLMRAYSAWFRDKQGFRNNSVHYLSCTRLARVASRRDVGMPSKLHMTVPPGFRRNAAIPKVLVLHKADLPPANVERRQGYAVVRPLRAIADLLREGTESRDRLRQALLEGMRRGIITRTELARHPDRKVLEGLLEGKA